MRAAALGIMVAGLVLAAGCGGGVDRAGGERAARAATLTLATTFDEGTQLRPWIEEVERRSEGRVHIRLSTSWRSGEVGAERGLIGDVRAGKAPLAVVGSSAWPAAGVHSLDAFNVPFEVDSYALEGRVLGDASAGAMLDGVSAAGVQPVALLPGRLHVLVARRPVRDAGGVDGLRLVMSPNPVGERVLRRLAARPVEEPHGGSIGTADGIVASLGDVFGADYSVRAPFLVADLPVWANPLVVVASRQVWERLDDGQRRALRAAAGRVRAGMLRAAAADDRRVLAGLCRGRIRPVSVGAAGRAALRRAVASAATELSRQKGAAAGFRVLRRARIGAPAPTALSCAAPVSSGPRAGDVSGTYTVTLRRSDRGAQSLAADFDRLGVDRVVLRLVLGDGRAVITETARGHGPMPAFDESLHVFRDRMAFGGESGPPITARWTLHGDRLSFSDIHGEPADRFVWGSHPWIRTGR